MGIEIERKFLVKEGHWKDDWKGTPYVQGYLAQGSGQTVRIRIAGHDAFLTIKGPVTGISRAEFEYPIPSEDARELMKLCGTGLIEKSRYRIPFSGRTWEVDEFHGNNAGLVVAEVELESPDDEIIPPPWIADEVTGDPRYYNSNLAAHPFSFWRNETA